MKIVGYQGVSLIDYPGKVATVLFTPGCNFLCPYCQNPDLIHPSREFIDQANVDINTLLAPRFGFIEGVSITGGEPTLQTGLVEFLRMMKAISMPVKLDTNGYLPDVLEALISQGLVSFVAMDVKTSLDNYARAAGRPVETKRIQNSIDLLLSSTIDYEFRTTVVPEIVSEQDIIDIAKRIAGARCYRLHQFQNKVTLDPALADVKPFPPEVLLKMADSARVYVPDTMVRGI